MPIDVRELDTADCSRETARNVLFNWCERRHPQLISRNNDVMTLRYDANKRDYEARNLIHIIETELYPMIRVSELYVHDGLLVVKVLLAEYGKDVLDHDDDDVVEEYDDEPTDTITFDVEFVSTMSVNVGKKYTVDILGGYVDSVRVADDGILECDIIFHIETPDFGDGYKKCYLDGQVGGYDVASCEFAIEQWGGNTYIDGTFLIVQEADDLIEYIKDMPASDDLLYYAT